MSGLEFGLNLAGFILSGTAGAFFWADGLAVKGTFNRAASFISAVLCFLVCVVLFVTLVVRAGEL